jgi:hypothetical protein
LEVISGEAQMQNTQSQNSTVTRITYPLKVPRKMRRTVIFPENAELFVKACIFAYCNDEASVPSVMLL